MKILYFFNHYKIQIVFLAVVLSLLIGVRLPSLFNRSIWYDEAITLLETAGNASPWKQWPRTPTSASIPKSLFEGTPTLTKIAKDLRDTDVHPPFYYWLLSLWRRWVGFSLETSRIFSLICSMGTILALYLLLRAGKIERPLIPTLIYGMSSGAVFSSNAVRAYALASLLIGMGALFAYLASEAIDQNKNRLAIAYSMGMALCCGIVFQTNYLGLFPSCIILLWFVVNIWSASKLVATAFPLIAISIWFSWFSSFLKQLDARPDQAKGFIGFVPEIIKIVKMNVFVLWTPIFANKSLKLVFIGILIVLVGTSLNYLLRNWSKVNHKLFFLLVGLVIAPSAGIFLMDIMSDKNLNAYRYVLFAGPSLVAILTYGIARPIYSQPSWIRPLIRLVLPLLLVIQLTGIDWGVNLDSGPKNPKWGKWGFDLGKDNPRTLANTIKASSSSSLSQVVVIGQGFGRGYPGSVIYELYSDAMVVILAKNTNLEKVQSDIQNYDDIWIVFASDSQTAPVEKELLRRLKTSERYTQVSREKSAIHLRKK